MYEKERYSNNFFRVGEADRSTTPGATAYAGVLKKHHLPTGGVREYTYESNTASNLIRHRLIENPVPEVSWSSCTTQSNPASNPDCCDLQYYSYDISFNSIDEAKRTLYEIALPLAPIANGGLCTDEASITLALYDVANSTVQSVATDKVEFPGPGIVPTPLRKQSIYELFDAVAANRTYRIRLSVIGSLGTFSLKKMTRMAGYPSASSQPVGGVRIKEIKLFDQQNIEKLTRRFEYEDVNGSSGKILYEPLYAFSYNMTGGDIGASGISEARASEVRDDTYVPLTQFDGTHVSYSRVTEIIPDNGRIIYDFKNHVLANTIAIVPPVPALPLFEKGKPLSTRIESQSGLLKQLTTYDGSGITSPIIRTGSNSIMQGIQIKSLDITRLPYPLGTDGSACYPFALPTYLFLRSSYPLLHGYYRLNKVTTLKDGVTNEESYTYASTEGYRYLTESTTKNSDGTVYRTEIKYPEHFSGSIYTELKARNILTPIERKTYVDAQQTDGQKFNYVLFEGFPRLSEVERYEATTDQSGTWNGAWKLWATVESYQHGKPHIVTTDGWTPETYNWTQDGRLLSKSFLNFTQTYDYYAGSQLLRQATQSDGTYVEYEYDPLSRLKTSRPYGKQGYQQTTTLNYVFDGQDANRPGNYVQTTVDYKVSTQQSFHTELNQHLSYQYFDGLGRATQTVLRNGYAPESDSDFTDLVSGHTTYDAAGRPQRAYRPFASPHTDGRFHVPPDATPYTETTYYSSPLNRQRTVTPPDWDPTTFAYGANAQSLTDPAGTSYPASSLMTHSVTDADGLKTITYGDRLGQTVLTEQYDAAGTRKTRTWNAYDDKQRLTAVYPPGTTASSANLICRYTYDGADNLLTKKIPDRPLERYYYNERDLVTYVSHDGLPNGYGYLATVLDGYGRPLHSGLTNYRNSGNESTLEQLPIGQRLSSLTYGPADNTFLHDKLTEETVYLLNGKLPVGEAIRTRYAYDAFGRVKRTEANHLLNLTDYTADVTSTLYTADGQVLKASHQVDTPEKVFATTAFHYYDRAGRLSRQTHRLSKNNRVGSAEIGNYHYTPAGELLRENIGGSQIVDYGYLSNGMLARINDPANPGDDLFALALHYTDGGAAAGAGNGPKSNGNITALTHYGVGAGTFTQTFTYDGLNRLTDNVTAINGRSYNTTYNYDVRGNFTNLHRWGRRHTGGYGKFDAMTYYTPAGTNKLDRITETSSSSYRAGYNNQASGQPYGYDAVGNVTTDPANGLAITHNYLNLPYRFTKTDGTIIDIIYSATGQKLRETTTPADGAAVVRSYLGDMVFEGDSLLYASHAHGRVLPLLNPNDPLVGGNDCNDTEVPHVPDLPGPSGEPVPADNLARAGTAPNRLYNSRYDNFLPEDRTLYEAKKTKVMAKVPTTNPVAFTGQRMVELRAGFSSPPGSQVAVVTQDCEQSVTWQYEYNLKDHLGNVRVRFADADFSGTVSADEVLAEHHYYPFGMEMEGAWNSNPGGSPTNRYLFNGIERIDELGLDLAAFRSYDPAIGRWLQVDPKAEAFTWASPYNSMLNNPISNIDPLGDTTRVYNMEGVLQRTINDSHANQEHFLTDRNLKILNGADHSDLDADGIGSAFRNGSSFFIGANTRAQLQAVAELAEADGGLERAYTLSFSSTQKELQVNDITGNRSRTTNEFNFPLPGNIPSSNGRNVIVGHVHTRAGALNVGKNPNNPADINDPSGARGIQDYESLLTGNRNRAYPQMINSVHGYNIYTSARNTPAGSSHPYPMQILSSRGEIINYSGVKIVN